MPYFSIIIFILLSIPAMSQNNLDVAACWGTGITIPSAHSTYEEPNQTIKMRISPCVHIGISAQYIIGNKFGIEAGAIASTQDYIQKGNYLQARSIDSYIPIQLLYRIKHPRSPFKHFTILAGTGLHWIHVSNNDKDYKLNKGNTLFTPCAALGIRMGGDKRRLGRLEYGLDYQCSVTGSYKIFIHNPDHPAHQDIFSSTLSQLSFKIYYFFVNKTLSNKIVKESLNN